MTLLVSVVYLYDLLIEKLEIKTYRINFYVQVSSL